MDYLNISTTHDDNLDDFHLDFNSNNDNDNNNDDYIMMSDKQPDLHENEVEEKKNDDDDYNNNYTTTTNNNDNSNYKSKNIIESDKDYNNGDNNDKYYCQICFDTYNIHQNDGSSYQLPQCKHIFCKDCLKSFIKSNVNDGKILLKCFYITNNNDSNYCSSRSYDKNDINNNDNNDDNLDNTFIIDINNYNNHQIHEANYDEINDEDHVNDNDKQFINTNNRMITPASSFHQNRHYHHRHITCNQIISSDVIEEISDEDVLIKYRRFKFIKGIIYLIIN